MTEHEKDVYCEKLSLQRSKATPPGEQFMQTLSLRVDVNFQTPVEVCRRHMTWIIFWMSYIVWVWKSAHQNLANSPCKVGLKLINAESTTILQAGQMIRCFWSSCKKKKSGFRLRKKKHWSFRCMNVRSSSRWPQPLLTVQERMDFCFQGFQEWQPFVHLEWESRVYCWISP